MLKTHSLQYLTDSINGNLTKETSNNIMYPYLLSKKTDIIVAGVVGVVVEDSYSALVVVEIEVVEDIENRLCFHEIEVGKMVVASA